LAVRPGSPSEVSEAAAALQHLMSQAAPPDGPDRWTARLAELSGLCPGGGPTIRAQEDGPYLATGAVRIRNWLGEEVATRPHMALCRCGGSAIKPLCDGTHATVRFTSTKDPQRVADRRDVYIGQQVTILDNRGTCQHSGYCTDRLATVFHLGEEPFVSPSGGRMDEIIRAVRDCPSGALSYAIDGREAPEQVDYDNRREPGIEVTKDGPYRVTGGIPTERRCQQAAAAQRGCLYRALCLVSVRSFAEQAVLLGDALVRRLPRPRSQP
jgi:CDGSH-type Zn-finger protein/ferredoxin